MNEARPRVPAHEPVEAGGIARAVLHVGALWALAVAGPVYDVLRGNREFFVAHRAGQYDILLFVAIVSLLAPLGLAGVVWLAGRGSAALGRILLATVVGAFVALLAAQAIQSLSPPTVLHVVIAAGFGAVAGVLYFGAPVMRTFATWLSPAIAVFPLVLLLDSAMAPFVWPKHESAQITTRIDGQTPIVFVVFDQLPLTSLLSPDGTIDPATYPGFAELAGVSTWFRNATTVGELTTVALPPIVSGQFPTARRLPIARDYPYNLFSALGGSYAMKVFEPITALCPDDVCDPPVGTAGNAPVVPMVADAAVVFLHIVLPPALAAGLPQLTENWKGFVEAEGFQERWGDQRDRDRRRVLNNFLEAIGRDEPAQTLYFLHALLPHEPYQYLATGQASGGHRRLNGNYGGRWTTQDWPVVQSYGRHLMQVRYVDDFVRRLLERLRVEGLFDRAIIVVTSDHGVNFTPGENLKAVTRATARNILPVPLFVKAPHQVAGLVTDRNVQSIDVLPMIADLLDVTLPFATDGRSPLETDTPASGSKVVFHAAARGQMTFAADELGAGTRAMVEQRVQWFGTGPDRIWTPLVAPSAHLLDRRVNEVRIEEQPDLRISLDRVEHLLDVDPAADTVPAILSGRVRGALGRSSSVDLAIAINGRIAATTATYYDLKDSADGMWTATVNPAAYRKGTNDVRVFVVGRDSRGEYLAEGIRTSN